MKDVFLNDAAPGFPGADAFSADVVRHRKGFTMQMYGFLTLLGLDMLFTGLKLNDMSFASFSIAFGLPVVLMATYVLDNMQKDGV
ncbi:MULTISPECIES: hypothetical protein [Acetobacter]|uniref:Uncharacterized protein n=2 Tax=Acetobacter TaxID=434 RepID=A0A149VFL5_9PROT|nr:MULTISPECIES: hypothetical protein [Acetobacter]KXV72879.1 hypothetical protein AD952_01920 [Acetobacter cerevisiae]KXV78991.1 hypothetical protein AD954_00710 [Acetobacter cerevisiae]MCP1245357.1 hypothetical protein [Acetobacter cerevisiae]MCP1254933.1 hypothetical protein [Acetobacter cerevisiae]MCP1269951.1 hypothetical protein [Acetobacter cerevisiae]